MTVRRIWEMMVLGLVGMVFLGCDPTIHCPRGESIDFSGVDFMQGINYSVSRDELSIWLTTKQADKKGRECLPRNLSVQNLSCPEVSNVRTFPPSWVKGRPLMALYIGKASQIPKGELIQYDIYQKEVKKQTVQIAVDFRDESIVLVTVNGEQVAANKNL